MEMWMAALMLGLVFAGVFTLAEIVVGTVLLRGRIDGMVLLVPLTKNKGEQRLRSAVAWLEWQRGVFPGHAAAVDLGLEAEERRLCQSFCRGSGLIWLNREEGQGLESLVEKLNGMDYT